ncbi:unnamed protein product [Amoebophrya sp. A120]|nr:unnamed protein product [Amoebophrya sp. A120]|eukprot:GSA120T00019854001.1
MQDNSTTQQSTASSSRRPSNLRVETGPTASGSDSRNRNDPIELALDDEDDGQHSGSVSVYSAPATVGGDESPSSQSQSAGSGVLGTFFSSTVGMLFGVRPEGQQGMDVNVIQQGEDGTGSAALGTQTRTGAPAPAGATTKLASPQSSHSGSSSSFHDADEGTEPLRTASVPSSPSKSSGSTPNHGKSGLLDSNVAMPLTAPAAAGQTMANLDLSLTVPGTSSSTSFNGAGTAKGGSGSSSGAVSSVKVVSPSSGVRSPTSRTGAAQQLQQHAINKPTPSSSSRSPKPASRLSPPARGPSSSSTVRPREQQLRISTSFATSDNLDSGPQTVSSMHTQGENYDPKSVLNQTAPARSLMAQQMLVAGGTAATSSQAYQNQRSPGNKTTSPNEKKNWSNAMIAMELLEEIYPKNWLQNKAFTEFTNEMNNIDLTDLYDKTPNARNDTFAEFREAVIKTMIQNRFGSPAGGANKKLSQSQSLSMTRGQSQDDSFEETVKTIREPFDETGDWQWPVYQPRSAANLPPANSQFGSLGFSAMSGNANQQQFSQQLPTIGAGGSSAASSVNNFNAGSTSGGGQQQATSPQFSAAEQAVFPQQQQQQTQQLIPLSGLSHSVDYQQEFQQVATQLYGSGSLFIPGQQQHVGASQYGVAPVGTGTMNFATMTGGNNPSTVNSATSPSPELFSREISGDVSHGQQYLAGAGTMMYGVGDPNFQQQQSTNTAANLYNYNAVGGTFASQPATGFELNSAASTFVPSSTAAVGSTTSTANTGFSTSLRGAGGHHQNQHSSSSSSQLPSNISSQNSIQKPQRTVLCLDKLIPDTRPQYGPSNEIDIYPEMEVDPETLLVFPGKKRKRKRKRRSRKKNGADGGEGNEDDDAEGGSADDDVEAVGELDARGSVSAGVSSKNLVPASSTSAAAGATNRQNAMAGAPGTATAGAANKSFPAQQSSQHQQQQYHQSSRGAPPQELQSQDSWRRQQSNTSSNSQGTRQYSSSSQYATQGGYNSYGGGGAYSNPNSGYGGGGDSYNYPPAGPRSGGGRNVSAASSSSYNQHYATGQDSYPRQHSGATSSSTYSQQEGYNVDRMNNRGQEQQSFSYGASSGQYGGTSSDSNQKGGGRSSGSKGHPSRPPGSEQGYNRAGGSYGSSTAYQDQQGSWSSGTPGYNQQRQSGAGASSSPQTSAVSPQPYGSPGYNNTSSGGYNQSHQNQQYSQQSQYGSGRDSGAGSWRAGQQEDPRHTPDRGGGGYNSGKGGYAGKQGDTSYSTGGPSSSSKGGKGSSGSGRTGSWQ